MITSCEPYISKGVVKPFLKRLLLIVIYGNLRSLMIFVILRLIVVIAAPCFGSETHSFAMPGGTHLQSMLTPVPLWDCCLLSCLSCLSEDTFLFFLSVDNSEVSLWRTWGVATRWWIKKSRKKLLIKYILYDITGERDERSSVKS